MASKAAVRSDIANQILQNDDLTTATIRRHIMQLAWPSLIEMCLTSLMSLVDQLMVARLGASAVSAVGVTQQPVLLMMVIFQAFNVGGTALASRFIGQRDPESARRVTAQIMTMNFVFSATLSVFMFIFAKELVLFMGADASYLADATTYLRYNAIGMATVAIPSAVTAALRAAGETRIPLYYNTTSNLINIPLNALLIFGLGPFPMMGVEGAALATLIGRIVAMVIALVVIFRMKRLPVAIDPKDLLHLDFGLIKRIVKVGFPSMMESVCMRVGLVVFTKAVVGIGVVEYASHQLALNVQMFSTNISMAFGAAATTLTGINLGAKKPDMAERYVRVTRRIGLIVSLALGALLFLFGPQLARIFVSGDDPEAPEMIFNIALCMKFMLLIMPAQTSQMITSGSLRGAGDTVWPLIAVATGILVMRSAVAVVLINHVPWDLVSNAYVSFLKSVNFSYMLNYVPTFPQWQLFGAWLSFMLDQSTRALVVLLRFQTGKWKTRKV